VSKKEKKAKDDNKTGKRQKKAAGKGSPAKGGADAADEGPKEVTFAYQWHKDVPLNVRAMVLCGPTLFVAGPPRFDESATYAFLNSRPTDESKLPPLLADAQASVEGKQGALLWAVNKSDGKKLAACTLDSPPVFDGLIAAGGRLYLSTVAGRVVCLGQ
jgi:hypothetical protein